MASDAHPSQQQSRSSAATSPLAEDTARVGNYPTGAACGSGLSKVPLSVRGDLRRPLEFHCATRLGGVKLSTSFLATVCSSVPSFLEFSSRIREVTGLSLSDAKQIADRRLAMELSSESDARYIGQVLSATGTRGVIVPLSADPDRPRLLVRAQQSRLDLGPEWPIVTSAAVSARPRSQARGEVSRARRIESMLNLQLRATGAKGPSERLSHILNPLHQRLKLIEDIASELRRALGFVGVSLPDQISRRPNEPVLALNDWIAQGQLLIRTIPSRMPYLKSNQEEYLARVTKSVTSILAQQRLHVDRLCGAAVTSVEEIVKAAFSEQTRIVADAVNRAVAGSPRRDYDWWVPAWMGNRLGLARSAPTVSPAVARLRDLSLMLSMKCPWPSTRTFAEVIGTTEAVHDLPSFQVEVDLDEVGGFVTTHKEQIETAAVDLLGQLTGGRIKVDVFDPLQLGDSARFLFDLNEAGDRILADAIWTTNEHIATVLQRLEEHITFVTQKYLRGHDSLTQYNVEAGEIAEPYRLLILYDFPEGFSRDGKHFDEEQMARLERIAAVGRRAGVYLFVHTHHREPIGRLSSLLRLDAQGLGLSSELVVEGKSGLHITDPHFTWDVVSNSAPDDATRRTLFSGLLRDLQSGDTAKVDPATISELSKTRSESDLQRGLVTETITDVDDPDTWWHAGSTDRLLLQFGRMGAREVAQIEFNSALESSALIGGRTGSGKSFLIHALIMDAITRYSPEELTLYLCDLKEGVEFKQYVDAQLPHARAIAVESNREFAVSLLEAIDVEISQRGSLFKSKSGGTAVNISQFRRESGRTWPRVMMVIDEFQKLFEQDDQLSRRAMLLLERVIKEGRAFGVHTVLATQSLGNVDASFKSLAGQIPYRLVLASSDNDSRILLGDDNADAKLLTKAGEGILNAKGGAKESNQRFQTTYWASEHRERILADVTALARRAGFDRHPHVFEGNAEVSAADYEPSLYLGHGRGITLPVGAPMSLEPAVTTVLERAPGSNLLIVDVEGIGSLAVLATSLLAQRIEVTAVDFAAIEQEWEPAFQALVDEGLDKPNRRRAREVVDLLLMEVTERHANNDYGADPKVLIMIGVHRARELDPDDYNDDSLLSKVRQLTKDGPEVGIHVIAWVDRKASLDRRFDSQTQREFGLRFLGRMSEDDSRSLADTERAAALTPAQLVFDDFDKAVTLVARRLGFPGPEWIRSVVRGTGD